MVYQTIDIKLGAVLLCEIPEARFVGLDMKKLFNSKRVVLIDYPAHYEGALKKAVGDYARKIQVVNVYQYNRALCLIRDALRGNIENGERLQAIGARGGKS